MKGRLVPVLFLTNALLLAAIVLVWLFGSLNWTAPDAVPVDASLFAIVAEEQAPAAAYDRANVFGRPLFIADRRPIPPEAVVESSPEQPPPPVDGFAGVRLLGVVGEGNEAFVIIQSDGKSTRLRVGGEFATWKLRAADMLGADFVSTTGENRRITIQRGGMANPGTVAADSTAAPAPQAAPGTPQARAAERRARRDALLRQAQERSQ